MANVKESQSQQAKDVSIASQNKVNDSAINTRIRNEIQLVDFNFLDVN